MLLSKLLTERATSRVYVPKAAKVNVRTVASSKPRRIKTKYMTKSRALVDRPMIRMRNFISGSKSYVLPVRGLRDRTSGSFSKANDMAGKLSVKKLTHRI